MATKDSTLTQDFLNNLFEYREGNLYWKNKLSDRSRFEIGKKAGSVCKNGYSQVFVNGKIYLLHRIIFMMHYGYMPKYIDHIDRNPSNNKIENLREATRGQNKINTALQKNNKSGYKNVCWHKKQKQWIVQVKVDGKNKYFGGYYDVKVAGFVAEIMRHKYYGKFAKVF